MTDKSKVTARPQSVRPQRPTKAVASLQKELGELKGELARMNGHLEAALNQRNAYQHDCILLAGELAVVRAAAKP